ncbi:hypothetical protein [Serratia odorifera]|uniref:Uncharacterized protein n=2 Tax=Serratia odorifera TaxID=618 RepID=D4E789_SEROD|nr:hypothetical protein [Serratia odorifera]EFE94465.1 hypothetical protein HMPREF0758_4039 [Serratia odorifera DSM 4582]PNK89175.1 hypothetical protein CEQ31_005385 [Serratia odorifera]RII70273.1 hypothetical protein DX901_20920 [Serratia odorifera]VDZ64006.1 Uncharacterised protein [Serratia odorifera]HEJ9094840.1 hypothetical protein [Serratia odorifera]
MRSDVQFIQQPIIDDQNFGRGDTVRLTTANLRHEYQLDVSILRREDKRIIGTVIAAAPKTDIPPKEWEIARGEEVVFRADNIAKAVPGAR